MRCKPYVLLGTASIIALSMAAGTLEVRADDTTEAILKRLDALEKENTKLKSELKRIETKPPAAAADAKPVVFKPVAANVPPGTAFLEPLGTVIETSYQPTAGSAAAPAEDNWFFRKKPGSKGLTFQTPGGEITAYGQLDVSIDDTTKGIANMVGPDGNHPVGNVGWMPAMSTNNAYVGLRGFQNIYEQWKFIYQLETQIDITASSGLGESNSNESNVVKGGLTSRNSFVGFSSPTWGSFMFGKTDAPYKNSTAIMNPFAGMLGDYAVVMGNTGGDNRVEFGTRLDHSICGNRPTGAA